MTDTDIQPYSIDVPQDDLGDLYDRLARTRWPDEIAGTNWDYGTNRAYLKQLVDYWHTEFDWRERETTLNRFSQFRAEVDGVGLHFVHERGNGPDPIPLVLLHGWPGSFIQMLDLVPMLTDPEAHGGNATDSFDVVVPSLPGYGFSDRATEPGMSVGRIADLVETLMTDRLGYDRYAARGSDLGAGVIEQLGHRSPDSLIGIHLSGSRPNFGPPPDDLTEAEQAFLDESQQWVQREGAYSMLHATKPQTVAYGLNDSPAGLAAWIVEKLRAWSDCDGDVEQAFTKDDLLTNLTIYWTTETINSSMRLYYESVRDEWSQGRVEVPTAMLMAPNGLLTSPREWSERFYNVERWTETSRGGHFLEWEEPGLVADDIRAFFRQFR